MIPEWVPNIHPLVVHFPIALLVTAVLFDAARLFFKKVHWLQKVVLALYATGSVGLIAAFWSGRRAVEAVSVTGDAIPVVNSHEDWALYTMIYFLVFTAIRFITSWKEMEKGFIQPLLVLIAFGGTGMLWYTGELGAKLVYKHGVGVGEIDRLSQQIEEMEQRLAIFREEAGPEIRDDGSWIWRIGPGAGEALYSYFSIDGDAGIITHTGREDGRTHLELVAPANNIFIHTGGDLRTIDGRIEINLSDFNGSFKLIHHFRDSRNYQYMRMDGAELWQGQIIDGFDNVLGSGQIKTAGWHTFRVTASGRHFYGYQNGNTIVHTHGNEMKPGTTGFSLNGEGNVKIRLVEFGSPT
jgi:uncharacterized membrane protein